jgi:hypothetical protein
MDWKVGEQSDIRTNAGSFVSRVAAAARRPFHERDALRAGMRRTKVVPCEAILAPLAALRTGFRAWPASCVYRRGSIESARPPGE